MSAGPLIGGVLIALLNWRSIFLVNILIGLVAIWLTLRYTRETPASRQRHLDLAGQLTAILTLGSLAAAIIEGGHLGWTNGYVHVCFIGSVISALVFLTVEGRSVHPMLPLSLFQKSAFSRRRTRLKVLFFDGSGIWLMTKRLEEGTFSWPQGDEKVMRLRPEAFAMLTDGIDLKRGRLRPWYEREENPLPLKT